MAPKDLKKPNHSPSEEEEDEYGVEETSGSDSDQLSGSDSGEQPKSTPFPAKRKRSPPAPAPIIKKAKKGKKNTVTVSVDRKKSVKGSKSAKAAPAINAATDDEYKKQLFQRIWSEKDEIVLLQGIIDFKRNPVTNPDAFHDFIREALHIVVIRAQLVDKIRKLRKKFVNNFRKGRDGKFAKAHDQNVYDLSKLIWSEAENKKNASKTNGKEKAFVQYFGRNDSSILSEEFVEAGMEFVEDSKRAELEVKRNKLMEKELEIYVERMELQRELALVVLEAVKASRS